MKRKFKFINYLLLFLFMAIAFSTSLEAKEKKAIEKEIKLSNSKIMVKVVFDAGKEEWGNYILSQTGDYLLALEKYLKQPFSFRKTGGFKIVGENEVYYQDKWVGGYNDLNEIHLQYAITQVGNPSLLYHELAHFWFVGGLEEIQWLVEGFASFLPIALLDAKYLSDIQVPREKIYENWGLRSPLPLNAKDLPTIEDFRSDANEFTLFYIKTFRIEYLIYKELGPENYRNFIVDILSRDTSDYSDDVMDVLGQFKEIDWREYLRGWVIPGKYSKYNMDDFKNNKI